MSLVEYVCITGIGFCIYHVLTSQSYKNIIASLIGIGVAIIILIKQ